MDALTRNDLALIIQHLPDISIEFDEWDYDSNGDSVGQYENESFHIENEYFCLVCKVSVVKIAGKSPHDRDLPPEHNVHHKSIDLKIDNIYIGEDEVSFTEEQSERLIKQIKKEANY